MIVLNRTTLEMVIKKHGITFQTITTPVDLILQAFGLMAGRGQNRALFNEVEMNRMLSNGTLSNDDQYYIHGNSGHSQRVNLNVPFQQAQLSPQ